MERAGVVRGRPLDAGGDAGVLQLHEVVELRSGVVRLPASGRCDVSWGGHREPGAVAADAGAALSGFWLRRWRSSAALDCARLHRRSGRRLTDPAQLRPLAAGATWSAGWLHRP